MVVYDWAVDLFLVSYTSYGVNGTIWSRDKNVYAINPDGSQKWMFTTGDCIVSSPAIGADGTIYVGSCDKNLYAINPDGSKKWYFVTSGEIHSSPAIGVDGTIDIGSSDGNLYAINLCGNKVWSFTTGGMIYSSPAIGADGTIYVGSYDKNLYAINLTEARNGPSQLFMKFIHPQLSVQMEPYMLDLMIKIFML